MTFFKIIMQEEPFSRYFIRYNSSFITYVTYELLLIKPFRWLIIFKVKSINNEHSETNRILVSIFTNIIYDTIMKKSAISDSFFKTKSNGQKKFVVLIDPDKLNSNNLSSILEIASSGCVDYFFIGGSLMVNSFLDQTIESIKAVTDTPIILFPGSSLQISYKADGILFLSLISGRNPELLIGKHVETAPFLKISPLVVIPTGYVLVDGGVPTSVTYMSNTYPIPYAKDDIALATAVAGEMLGMKLIFMDAGSGALNPISASMVEAVSSALDVPLVVGGGISTPEKAYELAKAGADIVVVGNAIEKDPSLIIGMADAIHSLNK